MSPTLCRRLRNPRRKPPNAVSDPHEAQGIDEQGRFVYPVTIVSIGSGGKPQHVGWVTGLLINGQLVPPDQFPDFKIVGNRAVRSMSFDVEFSTEELDAIFGNQEEDDT
jgi:hypothetical protein